MSPATAVPARSAAGRRTFAAAGLEAAACYATERSSLLDQSLRSVEDVDPAALDRVRTDHRPFVAHPRPRWRRGRPTSLRALRSRTAAHRREELADVPAVPTRSSEMSASQR